ncbi:MAG: MMPL family transporter [Deltaproteobacteria bacterium]|nr:MMPL family transporter [Deltaproteobacteria bacterium]
MNAKHAVTDFSLRNHRTILLLTAAVTLSVALLATAPSLLPETFPFLNPVAVDTDPENMLSAAEPVRVFHNRMKKELGLYDIVVVGVVNERHADGVFNTQTLKNVYDLTEYAKTLRWTEDGREVGVVAVDIIAPSTVDNIEPAGLGSVTFEWLMPSPPATRGQALAIRDKALRIPFLNGTLVSEDGKALCLYLPITSKDLSYRVYSALRERIAAYAGEEEYHITGLPVAEDTFGVEMFIQMALSAPTAMLIIFLLMLLFFRKIAVIISPLVVALISVLLTMGALIVCGFPVHIMSSMISIFIMPIAVLDSIHVISEFFEKYQHTRDRRQTMLHVMDELFSPMLYTSLTSAAGFASLALTPIPPVQIFGIFVAAGIMVAWVLTITFIPACIMLIRPETLENFGAGSGKNRNAGTSLLRRLLGKLSILTYSWAKPVIALSMLVCAVAVYGISTITINDNPVKWFTPSHPIRIADHILNKHFGGTYMAYLALSAPGDEAFDTYATCNAFTAEARKEARVYQGEWPEAEKVFFELGALAEQVTAGAQSRREFYDRLEAAIEKQRASAKGGSADAWNEAGLFANRMRQHNELFKDPAVLRYLQRLQELLLETAVVGKTNSLADIIMTVHRELFEGSAAAFRIPDSTGAVAQCMLTYQSSHRPGDLWHFVTPDYRKTSIWIQLKSGDNRDMSRVVAAVDRFIAENPPPVALTHAWFGLTYINVVWQDKMVKGMLQSFIGSFLVVFLMMAVLFRSALWGLLSMIPLTITIGAIYGAVGLIGKDYDMPVAVLSSMTLGLAVDFAIHFLARSKELYSACGSWAATVPKVFAEPAIAISRNIIVIALGFTPLLLAPLMPYKTVGALLASILLVSGAATLVLLPALVRVLEKYLFRPGPEKNIWCDCGLCMITSVVLVVVIAMALHQFEFFSWSRLTWLSACVIPVLVAGCRLVSRRKRCSTIIIQKENMRDV